MSEACYRDYETPEFYSQTTRTARKTHRCYECGKAINAGERYLVIAGKWDGDFSTHKTCQRCVGVRDYVIEHVPCFCWAFGSMLEDASETIDRYRHELPGLWFGFGRLLVAAKRQKSVQP